MEAGAGRVNVARWRLHFAERGLTGIEKDAPRSGRIPARRNKVARRIIEATAREKPEGAMTHDYKRNGATTLFAALELAEGWPIGTCVKRHRHRE